MTMRDASRRHSSRDGPTRPPAKQRSTPGRIGRRRQTPAMTTTRRRWPAAANGARQQAMHNQERIAQIARELLRHHEIRTNDRLTALAYEAMALAEQSRRELGEARPE